MIAIISKKIPKYFFNFSIGIFTDIFAPIIAPRIPETIIGIAAFIFIFLLFKFIIIAVILVGIKKIKFAPWDMCCSWFRTAISKNISRAPPPHAQATYKAWN